MKTISSKTSPFIKLSHTEVGFKRDRKEVFAHEQRSNKFIVPWQIQEKHRTELV